NPPEYSGWVQFLGRTPQGDWVEVVPFRGEELREPRRRKPANVYTESVGNRIWMKIEEGLINGRRPLEQRYYRQVVNNYFCHRYTAYAVNFHRQEISDDGALGPPQDLVLLDRKCSKDQP